MRWKPLPAIAQLVEHLTVDSCSHQMVPGSIPGRRIYACHSNETKPNGPREEKQLLDVSRTLPRLAWRATATATRGNDGNVSLLTATGSGVACACVIGCLVYRHASCFATVSQVNSREASVASHATTVIASKTTNLRIRRRTRSHRQRDNCAQRSEGPSHSRAVDLRSGCKIGLRDRNSLTCTLSQNGYGNNHFMPKIYTAGHVPPPANSLMRTRAQVVADKACWSQTGYGDKCLARHT